MRAREAELLRAWRDVEVVNTVPVGKVRIMSGGGGDVRGKGKDKGDNINSNSNSNSKDDDADSGLPASSV
ncbi:hypothetical protein VTN02DRAFT_998 [Thermoascus thermophilus]